MGLLRGVDGSAQPTGSGRPDHLLARKDFATAVGSFHGTHCVVATPDGPQHFYFSDDHPGPPLRIVRGDAVREQVERND